MHSLSSFTFIIVGVHCFLFFLTCFPTLFRCVFMDEDTHFSFLPLSSIRCKVSRFVLVPLFCIFSASNCIHGKVQVLLPFLFPSLFSSFVAKFNCFALCSFPGFSFPSFIQHHSKNLRRNYFRLSFFITCREKTALIYVVLIWTNRE